MIHIYKEKNGIISPNSVWIALTGEYMYTGDSFLGLLYTMYKEWKNKANFVGF